MAEGIDEVGREPVDEAVTVAGLDPRVVVLEADNLPVGIYPDQQGAPIGVEKAGDCLDDCVLDRLVRLVLSKVPTGGGLELDGEILVVSDHLGDGSQCRSASEAELFGDHGGKLSIDTDPLDETFGDGVDIGCSKHRHPTPHSVGGLVGAVDARTVVAVGGDDVVENGLDLGIE